MAIAFDSSGTATGNGVATLTVDITPAAVGAVCYAIIFNATAPETPTFTGWTNLASFDETTATHTSMWWRVKFLGDTTFAPSWGTAEGSSSVWVSYTGVNTSTPHESFASQSVTTTGTTFATPSATSTAANRWAVSMYGARSTTSAFTWTADAAQTARAQVCNTSNRWASVMVSDSNGAVTNAAHSYTGTTSISDSHVGDSIHFLIPATATAAYVPAETTQLGGYF